MCDGEERKREGERERDFTTESNKSPKRVRPARPPLRDRNSPHAEMGEGVDVCVSWAFGPSWGVRFLVQWRELAMSWARAVTQPRAAFSSIFEDSTGGPARGLMTDLHHLTSMWVGRDFSGGQVPRCARHTSRVTGCFQLHSCTSPPHTPDTIRQLVRCVHGVRCTLRCTYSQTTRHSR
jgi:hypothetical protein